MPGPHATTQNPELLATQASTDILDAGNHSELPDATQTTTKTREMPVTQTAAGIQDTGNHSDLPEPMQRMRTRNFDGMPVIPVVAGPCVTHGINTAEHKHIKENGITESPA